jgi:5-methylcytosine-specific restriction endonuclease McrA
LEEILMGMHPSYPPHKLRKKLFGAKLKIEQCEICGYSEKRITDGKVPLILAFKDGERSNHILENLEIVCYNCYHNVYGNLFGITK